MSVNDLCSRLLRWRIHLEEYDYDKTGEQNSNADSICRIGALAKEGSDSD